MSRAQGIKRGDPGDHQPRAVHALAHAVNQALGNVGKTVFCTVPINANPVNQTESLKDLVGDMNRGGKKPLCWSSW